MDGTPHDIEALTFATARAALNYCDGEHEGCGGDAVAIRHLRHVAPIARRGRHPPKL